MLLEKDLIDSQIRNRTARRRILEVSQNLTALHIGPAFSCLEIVEALYFHCLRFDRGDKFILSKGHGAMAQYAILNARGQISDEDLFSVSQAHGKLGGHPDLHIDGVSASTGSLGHGLGIALGMAVAWKERGKESTVSVVMSDGELMEGSSWESLLLAPTLHLSQVTVVIDHNKSISRGKIPDLHPNLMPLAIKIEAFGWAVYEVDGHDTAAIVEAWNSANKDPRPCAIVAHTIKGKGVSFMEDIPLWAYRSPNKMEFRQAMQELGGEN